MYLIFDTETTGLPRDYNAPLTDSDNWPRMVQIAWQLHGADGALIEARNFIVRPDGFDIPFNAEKVHGISTAKAMAEGEDLQNVLNEFSSALKSTRFLVGHNISFDISIIGAELLRLGRENVLPRYGVIDTKDELTDYCALPGGKGGKFKWPKLAEMHKKLFGEGFDEAHNATADVVATARCFLEAIRIGVITAKKAGLEGDAIHAFKAANPGPVPPADIKVSTQVADAKKGTRDPSTGSGQAQRQVTREESGSQTAINTPQSSIDRSDFAHLHCHTQYSVLQATCVVEDMVKKASRLGMPGIAITDTGNMYGVFEFVNAVESENGRIRAHNESITKGESQGVLRTELKGVVGCEFYLTDNRLDRSRQSNGYQTVLLAKNKAGYHNLAKLSSISFSEGFYYVARIDREKLLEYKSDLIVTTGGLGGEVPSLILNVGERQAEEAFLWWKEHFGDDFYAELLNHGLPEEKKLNDVLIGLCRKHGVKYFPSNNVYYLTPEQSKAQEILMCVKDSLKLNEDSRGNQWIKRQFPNSEFYFKDQSQMKALFTDVPEGFVTISEILAKVESYSLKRPPLLPAFTLPLEFVDPLDATDNGKRGENAYLRHLTYEGARVRYGELNADVTERLDFELEVIAKSGYPGYFLIVQDFCAEARKMGVWVGPGRGSAAGSAVAYCIGITNVDPIKYDLLFERFLNPERVSLPDIDIDFDDEGRGRVIDYVVNKYGSKQVAQIITYGTMAAKSALRDTARVLDLPLDEANMLAKLVPDNITLEKLINLPEAELKKAIQRPEEQETALRFRDLASGNDLMSETIRQARVLEGSLRNTGIHACGVIITPEDISNLIPVGVAKDSDLAVTQYDNSVVESAGLLKMDFLGLRTLTILKDAIQLVKDRHGVDIDPDLIPLDDAKTYALYQRGETNGTFQFESPGMQKHLRALRPDKFGDLIAMNALYRPGPLEYIPNFIARKHGREEIAYDLPEMEEYLKETYGITVYQEQVMLLSQKLAGFSKGEADKLRKAMGKKIRKDLDVLKPKFIKGAKEKGHPEDILEKIWKDWEAFAEYAFNKSHSTCYSVVAFHTGYMKANWPAEYMAAVLTHNMNDLKKVTFFMDECRRMGIQVLGPDVNESAFKFTVNEKGQIRFGLGAVKGVGEGAVDAIVAERANGRYTSIFDLCSRVDTRSANRKAMESLAYAGAFDSFPGTHRAQYFHPDGNSIFLEKAMRYGASMQDNAQSQQVSLFGEVSKVDMPEPTMPVCEKWGILQQLNLEKDVVGVYISGHPLDDYQIVMKRFCNCTISDAKDPEQQSRTREYKFAAMVTQVDHRISKQGKPFGIMTVEDYQDSMELRLFGEDYVKHKAHMDKRFFLFIKGQYKEDWRDKTQLEFKVVAIELLTDLLERKANSINLRLPLHSVNTRLGEELAQIAARYPGTCKLNLSVGNDDGVSVRLHSKKYRVSADQALLLELERATGAEVNVG